MARIREVHLRFDLTDKEEREAWRILSKSESPKALVIRALREAKAGNALPDYGELLQQILIGQKKAEEQAYEIQAQQIQLLHGIENTQGQTLIALGRLEDTHKAPACSAMQAPIVVEKRQPVQPEPDDPNVLRRIDCAKDVSEEELKEQAAAMDPLVTDFLRNLRRKARRD